MLCLMHPKMPFTILAAGAHCWLIKPAVNQACWWIQSFRTGKLHSKWSQYEFLLAFLPLKWLVKFQFAISYSYNQIVWSEWVQNMIKLFLRTKSMSFSQRQRKPDKLSLFWTFGAIIIERECQEQGRNSLSDIYAQDIWA